MMNDHVTRARVLAALAAVSANAVTGPVRAADRERFDVAVGAEHALVYFPWELAKALGYFEREGLEPNLIFTKGGSEAAQALVSGSVDFSGNAIDHAFAAAAQGKSLVMVADFMNVPGATLLVRSEDKDKYKSVADLKGKTIGVTSPGSATHVVALWLAKQAGLSKDDVKIIGVGGGITMEPALLAGRVDAAMANDPFATQLMRAGRAVALLDLYRPEIARRATGLKSYVWTGALTRGDVIKSNPGRVQRVVNALVRAQKFMLARSAAEVAGAVTDEVRGGLSQSDWAPAFEHSRSAFTNHGEISLDGLRGVQETNVYFGDQKAATVDLPKLFDNSFVEKANRAIKRP